MYRKLDKKLGRNKLIGLFSILALIISAFMVFSTIKSAYADESTTDVVESTYLLNGEPYQSNLVAGDTSGYGKFVLNQENVTLSTTARSGFQLVGWQIIYLDRDSEASFIDANDLTAIDETSASKEIQVDAEGVSITYTLTFIDSNSDSYYDKGTYTISNIFENLQVNPVFDFVYYNVNLDAVIDVIDMDQMQSENINTTDVLYYSSSAQEENLTHYYDAIVYFNNADSQGYFYYGDLYKEGDNYFTIHEEARELAGQQYIAYTDGAFRLGTEVNFNININVTDDVLTSTNIDVLSANVVLGETNVPLVKDADDNGYAITQDEYLRTTAVRVQFYMLDSLDKTASVSLGYHNLYVANIVAYLDDEIVIDEERQSVLDVVSVSFEYSTISAGRYFIKNASDNNGNAFRVVCTDRISAVIDARRYDYYSFTSLDDETASSKVYSSMNENFDINIKYTSINYDINFEFRIYDSSTGAISVIDGDFNLEDTLSLPRGKVATINKTDVSNNVGYAFYGFAFSVLDVSENDLIEVTIDYTRPSDVTVYMYYEIVDYTIVFTNFDQISLFDGENDQYPINRVSLTNTRGQVTNTYTIYANDLRTAQDNMVAFDCVVNINDTITIASIINSGFYLLGYKFNDLGDYSLVNGNSFNFTLNSELLAQIADENDQIMVYVYEDYLTYEVNYYIDAAVDTYTSLSTIMANISVVSENSSSEDIVFTEGENRNQYTISNLKMYDEVVLNAAGIHVVNEEQELDYTYAFNRFTENDIVNLTYSYDSESNTYSHTQIIERSITIKVVYSMPSTRLFVSTNNAVAYDMSNLVVYQNNEVVEDTGNGYIVESGASIRVVLNPNSETADEIFTFGYTLVSYTFNVDGVDTTIDADNLYYEFTVNENKIQYLILNFVEIEYNMYIYQYGANFNGEAITFGENDFTSISIENRVLEFNMPEGYYVSQVEMVNNGNHAYDAMNQSNDYQQSVYYYEFSEQEMRDIVNTYGIQSGNYINIYINVHYQIHTYTMQITYGLTNPKNNDYDRLVQYPSISLECLFNGTTNYISGSLDGQVLTFNNIPYGSQITARVDGSIPSGLSVFGWTDEMNISPSYEHSSTQMLIPKFVQNEYFLYKLTYQSYNLNVVIDNNNQGNPTIIVNDVESSQITLYDNLKIAMNANKTNGFMFTNMYYYRYEYQQYVYDDASWATDYASLYYYSDGNFVRNNSAVYDANQIYYRYVQVTVEYNESTLFEDTLFNVSNYSLSNGYITFYVEYDYMEISLYNESFNTGRFSLVVGDSLNITPDQYSEYTMYATDQLGERRTLTSEDTVNYLDTVEVFIRLNTVDLGKGETYDLSRGLYLAQVTMLSDYLSFETVDTGYYRISFRISDIIVDVPDTGELYMYYYYLVGQKNITITTNIDDPSFYQVDNHSRFEMSYNNYITGFGGLGSGDILSSGMEASLTDTLMFLGQTMITYQFQTVNSVDYSQFFFISNIKAYTQTGQEIPTSQYAYYGITIVRSTSNDYIEHLLLRFVEDITVAFQVQPVIYYNGANVVDGDYVFTTTFECDENGFGVPQSLTIGSSSSDSIQSSDFILNFLMDNSTYNVFYYDSNDVRVNPTNVGRYRVELAFNNTGDYSWLSDIELQYEIYFEILPKTLNLTYNMENTYTKTYDASSSFDARQLLQYMILTDGVMQINYETGNFVLADRYFGKITTTTDSGEEAIYTANEDMFYNITVYNLYLTNTIYNNNFVLSSNSLTFYNKIRIMRKALTILGVEAQDKIYDGTTDVTLKADANIRLQGVINDDDVTIIVDDLILQFTDAEIGENKWITIDSSQALTGIDAFNYKINEASITAAIYPYSVSANVDGFGTITVFNDRGLTDNSLVGLIPVGATLQINVINVDTPEYANLYQYIARFLSSRHVFVVGYSLNFVVDGMTTNVDNNLYVSIPNVEDLTDVIWLTGTESGELSYTEQDNQLIIDLSQNQANIGSIILTQQRALLELWQIILIVVAALLLIAIIIIIFIVIRKKKKEEYSVNDKI